MAELEDKKEEKRREMTAVRHQCREVAVSVMGKQKQTYIE